MKRNKRFLSSLLFIVIYSLSLLGCTSSLVHPQQGGKVELILQQPENAAAPTQVECKATLGRHQQDEARSGYTAVQKTKTIVQSQNPLMYAGIALIVVSLGMSYFQAKFPVLFTPGLKLIGLTFLSGLTLCVLPALTQNTMIWILGLFSSMAILLVFILSKTFTTSTK